MEPSAKYSADYSVESQHPVWNLVQDLIKASITTFLQHSQTHVNSCQSRKQTCPPSTCAASEAAHAAPASHLHQGQLLLQHLDTGVGAWVRALQRAKVAAHALAHGCLCLAQLDEGLRRHGWVIPCRQVQCTLGIMHLGIRKRPAVANEGRAQAATIWEEGTTSIEQLLSSSYQILWLLLHINRCRVTCQSHELHANKVSLSLCTP